MWIIALLFGFGLGGLCEYFRRERELRRQYTKEGTPSASHNSAMPKLPQIAECMRGIGCWQDGVVDNEFSQGAQAMYIEIRRRQHSA